MRTYLVSDVASRPILLVCNGDVLHALIAGLLVPVLLIANMKRDTV